MEQSKRALQTIFVMALQVFHNFSDCFSQLTSYRFQLMKRDREHIASNRFRTGNRKWIMNPGPLAKAVRPLNSKRTNVLQLFSLPAINPRAVLKLFSFLGCSQAPPPHHPASQSARIKNISFKMNHGNPIKMQPTDYVRINGRTIASISKPRGTKIARSQGMSIQ